jgi:hypothetical protein
MGELVSKKASSSRVRGPLSRPLRASQKAKRAKPGGEIASFITRLFNYIGISQCVTHESKNRSRHFGIGIASRPSGDETASDRNSHFLLCG